MYPEFFQLSRNPFSLVPPANGCILVPSLKRELNRCLEAIQESRCPVMIAGPSGCSKSIMLALIENHFAREIRTIRLDCASLTNRIELIQSLLGEMGLKFGSESVGELRLRMIDFLKSSDHCPNGLLLLVDEAQLLTDEVLEELRLMTNLVCSGRSQVRLVLAGSLCLEENVSRKESFNQRITIRCYPRALSQNETMLFVLAQMQLAGRDGREIFKPSALEKIHALSGGVPRVICQLGDNAMRFAARDKRSQLDASVVEASWYDLQQLPIPESRSISSSPGSKSTGESVIEFGSLSDESPDNPGQWTAPGASERASHQAHAKIEEESHHANPWEEPDSMESMDDSSAIDDDGYFVAETESHTEVDATLQTLLKQLDEYEVAEKEDADGDEKPVSRRADDKCRSGGVKDAGPIRQQTDTTKRPVDSSNVFGNDYDMEEDVVDIQSLRISGQNRASARTSSIDVSGIVEQDASPAWMPVGNEIVFPFGAEPQDHDPEAGATRKAQPAKVPKADASARSAAPRANPSVGKTDDDRDMIIVQESKQSKPDESSSDSTSAATPASPAPTGNVIRMDYQELFKQLRNNKDVEQ